MSTLNVDKIFLCHSLDLSERRKFQENQLEVKFGFKVEWITAFPSKHLTNTTGLKSSELSLALKHMTILQYIVDENIQRSLVLEDDAVLDDHFIEKFNLYIKQVPKDADFITLEDGSNFSLPKISENVHQGYDCHYTCGFVITLNCAKQILNEWETNLIKPSDHMYNYCFRKFNSKVYSITPQLIIQGSQTNIFKSSLR